MHVERSSFWGKVEISDVVHVELLMILGVMDFGVL